MSRFSSVLAFLFLLQTSVSGLDDISGPKDPVIDDVKIPEVKLEAPAQAANTLISVRVKVLFEGGQALSGVLMLSNPTLFWQTNENAGSVNVQNWTVFQIGEIEIMKWKPDQREDSLVLFEPIRYRITGEGTNRFIHEGRIPMLDRLVVDTGDRKMAAFTLFYDRWIEGKKGVFRWETARNANFEFHLERPVEGTAVKIRFPDHTDAGEGR